MWLLHLGTGQPVVGKSQILSELFWVRTAKTNWCMTDVFNMNSEIWEKNWTENTQNETLFSVGFSLVSGFFIFCWTLFFWVSYFRIMWLRKVTFEFALFSKLPFCKEDGKKEVFFFQENYIGVILVIEKLSWHFLDLIVVCLPFCLFFYDDYTRPFTFTIVCIIFLAPFVSG